jgi:hypothetical protein
MINTLDSIQQIRRWSLNDTDKTSQSAMQQSGKEFSGMFMLGDNNFVYSGTRVLCTRRPSRAKIHVHRPYRILEGL